MTISIDLIKKLRDITLAPLGDCKEALVEAQWDLDSAQEILKKKGAIKADKKADRETNNGVVKFSVVDNVLVGLKLLCETDFVSKNDSFGSLVDQIMYIIANESQDIDPDSVSESLMDRINTVLKDNAVTIGENMKVGYIIKKSGQSYAYNHTGNTLASAIFYTGEWDATTQFVKDCALQIAAMNPLYISTDNVDPERISKLTAEFTEEMVWVDKPADIKAKIIEGRVQKSLQDDILLEQVSIKDWAKKVKELQPQWCNLLSMIRVSI